MCEFMVLSHKLYRSPTTFTTYRTLATDRFTTHPTFAHYSFKAHCSLAPLVCRPLHLALFSFTAHSNFDHDLRLSLRPDRLAALCTLALVTFTAYFFVAPFRFSAHVTPILITVGKQFLVQSMRHRIQIN
jgi:hypothetical protein